MTVATNLDATYRKRLNEGAVKLRNCLILGCGRSGTSATAGCLAKAGYFMGNALIPARVSNPDGVFEDYYVRSVNEEILSFVVPRRHASDKACRDIPEQWQRWLARLSVETVMPSNPAVEKQIQDLLVTEPYCFKDPRLTYTLPVWRPHLKDTVFVCLFRDPATTAASMVRFTKEWELMHSLDLSFQQALEAWELLNRHVIEKHRHAGEWLFLHLQQIVAGDGLARLGEFTGAKIDGKFARPERQRTCSAEQVPQSVDRVYKKLCQLAEFRPA
jgi:hypothetical protein